MVTLYDEWQYYICKTVLINNPLQYTSRIHFHKTQGKERAFSSLLQRNMTTIYHEFNGIPFLLENVPCQKLSFEDPCEVSVINESHMYNVSTRTRKSFKNLRENNLF